MLVHSDISCHINIASQLQCISASAAGTSAIPVTDELYFSIAM